MSETRLQKNSPEDLTERAAEALATLVVALLDEQEQESNKTTQEVQKQAPPDVGG